MSAPSWACAPCGFVGPGLVPFSAEWYRQHRDAHLDRAEMLAAS